MITTSKAATVVGLDIGTASVAAVELRVNGDVSVAKTAIAPLPEGASQDGEVADPSALSAALKDLFSSSGLSKDVRLGVANQRVVVRTLTMPRIDKRDEIENAVRFVASEQVQMPLDDAVFDWQVLDPGPSAANGQMEVAVVAARWDMVRPLIDTVRAAGLRPVGLDVSAFGMIRALSKEAPVSASGPYAAGAAGAQGSDGAPAEPARLFCSFGDITNIAIARGSGCLFTRIFPFGMESIATALAERRQLTQEHARMWLEHVGLEAPVETLAGDPEIIAAAREVLTEGASKLAAELRLSLDYYGTQEGAQAIEEIVICGRGSAIAGVPAALQAELGLALRPARPVALAGFPTPEASRLTIPYGLALNE